MSGKKLRPDKKCQNCGHFVAERFCPHCGQENTETRQPFYRLFTHFVTDFIHYDNRFWRTVRDLYRPAKLPKAYLAGKRTSYASPFHLYLFISFLVFFTPAVLPDMNKTHNNKGDEKSTIVENPPNTELGKRVRDKISEKGAEEVWDALVHYFPKAIFLYMPVFAFCFCYLFYSYPATQPE